MKSTNPMEKIITDKELQTYKEVQEKMRFNKLMKKAFLQEADKRKGELLKRWGLDHQYFMHEVDAHKEEILAHWKIRITPRRAPEAQNEEFDTEAEDTASDNKKSFFGHRN